MTGAEEKTPNTTVTFGKEQYSCGHSVGVYLDFGNGCACRLGTDSHGSEQLEKRDDFARYLAKAVDSHDALRQQNEQLLEALEVVTEQIGWRGDGEHATDIFYCEGCQESHSDYTKIAHLPECFVLKVRAAISAAKGK